MPTRTMFNVHQIAIIALVLRSAWLYSLRAVSTFTVVAVGKKGWLSGKEEEEEHLKHVKRANFYIKRNWQKRSCFDTPSFPLLLDTLVKMGKSGMKEFGFTLNGRRCRFVKKRNLSGFPISQSHLLYKWDKNGS